MTTHRKLKYSVSDASRRMYRDETNGIYRKLDNPSPTENQLRQQKFEARQRPLSHILASSSFREDYNREQITRGQSLSNLKKARLRNSLNLPHSFSLDLGYDVDANANLDDFSARSGNLREITVSGDSAFSFVPERDIISLGDISSSHARNCRASNKSPSVASFGSKRSDLKSEKIRKSSTSTSSSSSSTSRGHSSRSRSSSPKPKYKTKDIEHVLDNATDSEDDESSKIQKVLHKRPSFKEIFPEPVNQEFMDKSVERKSLGRLSFSEKDTNRIFDSEEGIQTNVKNGSSSLRRTKLNTSLSTDSGESDSPKAAHKVFDSTDHFQRSFLFPGTVNKPETTPSDSESSCKEGSYILDSEFNPSEKSCVSVISPHSLAVSADLPSLDNTENENGYLSDIQMLKQKALKGNLNLDRTVSLGDTPPPLPQSSPPDVIEKISLDSYAGNDFGPSEVKQMTSESFVSAGKSPGYLRTSVAYYGPIYASNNTLILPTKSAQPPLDYLSDDDTTSNSSGSSTSSNHKSNVQNAEKENVNVSEKVIFEKAGLTENTRNRGTGSESQNDYTKRNSLGSSSSNEEHYVVHEDQITEKDDNTIYEKAGLTEVTQKQGTASGPQYSCTQACSEQESPRSINREIHQVLETLDNAILGVSADTTEQETVKHRGHHVVVAIDFGTTYSGYAYSFTRDPSHVHLMRKWEGGDPGVINEKTPTSILLTPEGQFHSFGYSARDNYHDLGKEEAKTWMYFEKFKMILHNTPELSKDTLLKASNGRLFPAMNVFSLALKFFRDHALQELSDQSGMKILNEDVRWVISVPAIWRASAKQFIRQAAYEGGLVSSQCPEQLIIALEPEAASIYCRKLKMYQLVPEMNEERPLQSPKFASVEPMNINPACEDLKEGSRYMVVDCGGGTVDITVHQVDKGEKLTELYRASGGPYGSVGIDLEFEKVLDMIFGKNLMENYRQKCPAGWVDLMIAFESRKRSASPHKSSPLNVALPFSFIDYCRKHKLISMEHIVKRYGDKDIQWSRLGMLRLTPEAMKRLFLPTINKIKQAVGDVLNARGARDLNYMFLVGGFAESAVLQDEIRKEFGSLLKVIIPQGVGLTILKGSVLFGLDPTVVHIRKSRVTYGLGVLNTFRPDLHPVEKKMVKEDTEWCMDVFDKFVLEDQPMALGDVILRSYKPACRNQKQIQINIYSAENPDTHFITEKGVKKCGILSLDLEEDSVCELSRREIQTRMVFGETEIRVSALDVCTGHRVQAVVDFLSY
ncbi:uncharacterized protein LOC134246362 isoform X2 [Saccostrea cucullata]|uniref:uncharacterized protein LOC134246362 isoform X2 n=1 Tax=Saccostrea cuccullata TaxID=36930 RepID=UPI002ED4675B